MREKRLFWTAFFVFVSLSLSFFSLQAEAKVVSNSTYQTGGSITLNGTTYVLSVSIGNSTGLILTSGNTTYSFALGECELFFDEMMCYTGKTGPTARLTVYNQDAVVKAERSVTQSTKLSVGKEYSFNITLNNTGRTEATDVLLDVRYPHGFRVEEIIGCAPTGDRIVWEGRIKERDTFECRATLMPLWETKGSITTNVTYRTISGLKTVDIKPIEIEAGAPDWIDINITPKETGIGGTVTIWMNLTANKTTNLTIKSIQVPLGDRFIFEGSSYAQADARRNILSFGRNIRQNTSFIFEANLTAIKNGTLPLNISIIFGEAETLFVRQFWVNVTILPLEVSIQRDLKGGLEPGRQEHFKVLVRNPNEDYDVSHYDVTVTSGLPGLNTGYYKADVGDSLTRRIVYDTYYAVPEVNETVSFDFDVQVVGHDGFLQTLTGHVAETVEIHPLGELTILKGINFSNIGGKNKTVVKVFVKSSYARTITGLKVQETVPDPFYYKGSTEALLDIKPGDMVEAYSYELSLPYNEDTGHLKELLTTAHYEYNTRTYTASANATADPSVIRAFLYPGGESVEMPEEPPVEQPTKEGNEGLVRLFIIFDIALVILAVAYFLGINLLGKGKSLGHSVTLALRERRVKKSDEKISSRLAALSQEEGQVMEESAKVEVLIVDLEKEIARQNKTVPKEIGKNDSRTKDLEIQFAKLEEEKQGFEKKIVSLKEKEDEIIKRQQEITARKVAIAKRNEELRQNKTKIIADITQFKDKLLSLHDNLEKMKHQKDDASGNREGLFKARLEVIQKRLAHLEDQEKALILQEKKIEEEKKKMKQESQSIEKDINARRKKS